jgi:outer membrane protein
MKIFFFRMECMNKKQKGMRTVFFLFAVLSAAGVCAQEPAAARTVTISDAVTLAVQNNVSIKRGALTLEKAKRADAHSWNSISPSLDLSAGTTRPNDTSSYDSTSYIEGKVSVSLSPALITSIQSARLSYEAGRITYAEACRAVELSVRTSFYSLLYENENIKLQERNLETARQQYEQNKAKYDQGRVSELDVLTAEVSYKKLIPTVESARVTWQNDMASFKQLLGVNQNESITLSGSLDDVLSTGTISLETVVSQSTAVALLEKELAAAKTAVLASRFSAYGPTVSAGWAYEPVTTKTASSSTSKDSGTLSLSVSIPLDGMLPWSSGADTVATAQDTVRDLELQLENEKTTVAVESQSYLRKISQAQAAVVSCQANIELAQKTYDMTAQAYSRGIKDLLSLQDASDSLLEAQVSLKSQAYTLISAVLNLENTLGVPFGSLGK